MLRFLWKGIFILIKIDKKLYKEDLSEISMEVLLHIRDKEPKDQIYISELESMPCFYGSSWSTDFLYLRPITNEGKITLSYIDAQQTPSANYDCMVEAFLRGDSPRIALIDLKDDLKKWEKRLKECDSYMRKEGKGNLDSRVISTPPKNLISVK